MQKRKHRILSMVLIVAMTAGMVIGLGGCGKKNGDELTITNVSYDPTREFYEKYNVLFEQYYEKNFGKKVRVIQSHGGSGSQARSVVEGCNADVVTLALEHDITLIEKTGLINARWQKEFDKDSAPYTSTIVFLVRKGNPKQIRDGGRVRPVADSRLAGFGKERCGSHYTGSEEQWRSVLEFPGGSQLCEDDMERCGERKAVYESIVSKCVCDGFGRKRSNDYICRK